MSFQQINPQQHIMESKVLLTIVWGFYGLAFITASGLMTTFAIVASITTIIRNYPYVKQFILDVCKKLKTKK